MNGSESPGMPRKGRGLRVQGQGGGVPRANWHDGRLGRELMREGGREGMREGIREGMREGGRALSPRYLPLAPGSHF